MKNIAKRIVYAIRNRHIHVTLCTRVTIGGFKTYFGGWNRIGKNTFFSGSIGRYSYIGDSCHVIADIGKFCSIANHVNTVSGKHPTRDWVSTHPAFYSTQCPSGTCFVDEDLFQERTNRIKIGNDVWIGDGATILGGVHIGDGAIIASGAVVTKDVMPYEIVGGVPAQRIRMRFSEEEIAFLLDFRWWDKDDAWLKDSSSEFMNIEIFRRQNNENM